MTYEDSDKNGAIYYVPRLRTLRIAAKLSINRLAREAEVGRDLVSSLERHHPHTLIKVRAIVDVLAKYNPAIDITYEITTHT